jgi:hypothetical protein
MPHPKLRPVDLEGDGFRDIQVLHDYEGGFPNSPENKSWSGAVQASRLLPRRPALQEDPG